MEKKGSSKAGERCVEAHVLAAADHVLEIVDGLCFNCMFKVLVEVLVTRMKEDHDCGTET